MSQLVCRLTCVSLCGYRPQYEPVGVSPDACVCVDTGPNMSQLVCRLTCVSLCGYRPQYEPVGVSPDACVCVDTGPNMSLNCACVSIIF